MKVSDKEQFQFMIDELARLEHSAPVIDQCIALVLGWKDVVFRPMIQSYTGLHPVTRTKQTIPSFTSSIDAARSIKPDKWVLFTREQFSGNHLVTLFPQEDLGKVSIETQSYSLAIAICHATMQAHHQMLE